MSTDHYNTALTFLKNNGFPFEMATAALFQEAGFGIHQSVYFEDAYESTIRELDLIALSNNVVKGKNFNIILLIECKYSLTPWILFSSITKGFEMCYTHNKNGARWLENLVKQKEFETFFQHESNGGYGLTVSDTKNNNETQARPQNKGKSQGAKPNAYAAI